MDKQQSTAAVGMEAFHTREASNDGVKVQLALPNGLPSGHWLVLYGADSDAFRGANMRLQRDALRISMIEDDAERDQRASEGQTRLVATLVKDWSFDQPCTPDNVYAFLRAAPQIEDKIDSVVANRALFFALRSSNSSDSSDTSSSSTTSPTEAPKPSAPPSNKSSEQPGGHLTS